jgi:hypothetical protein
MSAENTDEESLAADELLQLMSDQGAVRSNNELGIGVHKYLSVLADDVDFDELRSAERLEISELDVGGEDAALLSVKELSEGKDGELEEEDGELVYPSTYELFPLPEEFRGHRGAYFDRVRYLAAEQQGDSDTKVRVLSARYRDHRPLDGMRLFTGSMWPQKWCLPRVILVDLVGGQTRSTLLLCISVFVFVTVATLRYCVRVCVVCVWQCVCVCVCICVCVCVCLVCGTYSLVYFLFISHVSSALVLSCSLLFCVALCSCAMPRATIALWLRCHQRIVRKWALDFRVSTHM